jgi:UDP-N-acetylglucosamine 2-epimerase (non-hydrolysing)
MKLSIVVGARPNFTKISPIIREIEKRGIEYQLIHTGQHYDNNMSDVFFEELGIPKPHINLSVGSKSHAKQTADIMVLFEEYCSKEKPDVVVVVGDINSTIACALVVAKTRGIKLAHIEAGLRSFDREMPEEINRVVTDVLSDYLFCTAQVAVDNALREGIPADKLHLVGDVMIDNLIHNLKRIKHTPIIEGDYVLMTAHRPSNTDTKDNLESILLGANIISDKLKVVFPIHPRTKKQIDLFKLGGLLDKLDCRDPLNYLSFLNILKHAKVVLTDSGGVQPEAYYLKVPCITMRTTTEHVFTLSEGTNVIVGANKKRIVEEFNKLYDGLKGNFIENTLYDGKASERIVKILLGGEL